MRDAIISRVSCVCVLCLMENGREHGNKTADNVKTNMIKYLYKTYKLGATNLYLTYMAAGSLLPSLAASYGLHSARRDANDPKRVDERIHTPMTPEWVGGTAWPRPRQTILIHTVPRKLRCFGGHRPRETVGLEEPAGNSTAWHKCKVWHKVSHETCF